MSLTGHGPAENGHAGDGPTGHGLSGHTGVVTGAGRGLGREIAVALAAEGMSLLLLSRTGSQVRDLTDDLSSRFPGRVLPATIEVADPAAVDRVVAHVEQHLGPVDLLVNAAGRIESTERPCWEADQAEHWGVIETDLRGPLLMTRALLPSMVQRGRGRVVTLTSRARAATRTGTYTGYALSKPPPRRGSGRPRAGPWPTGWLTLPTQMARRRTAPSLS